MMDGLRRKPKRLRKRIVTTSSALNVPKKAVQQKHSIPVKTFSVQQLGIHQQTEDLPYCARSTYREDAAYTSSLAQQALRDIAQNDSDTITLGKTNASNEKSSFDHADKLTWRMVMHPGERGQRIGISPTKNTLIFVSMLSLALLIVGVTHSIGTLFSVKGSVMGVTQDGYTDLTAAVSSMSERDFVTSQRSLAQAEDHFSMAVEEMDRINQGITELSQYIPGASQLYSAEQLLNASLHLTRAGESLNRAIAPFDDEFSSSEEKNTSDVSLLELYSQAHSEFLTISEELMVAQESIDHVVIDDLPEEHRAKFMLIKQQLPQLITLTENFTRSNDMIVDLLGGNGPRKYLFLFQNNQEMRATGGFIGSYGLLDLKEGAVRDFFIEGIYNPDGQFTDKIVPPRPIQKISARWSLHDSNWFADFPLSAQKAMLFYEKTGGPTVDGVVAITPTLMENLIAIVGPIHMPEYDITITAENFTEKTRSEIEKVDEENQSLLKIQESNYDTTQSTTDEDDEQEVEEPKQILADLAPLLLAQITSPHDIETTMKIFGAVQQSMREKHILLYAQNTQAQEIITQNQWGGTIMGDTRDYLSIINTNINGYKTDGVIDESIIHEIEIGDDGSVIDTVSITRTHNGGHTGYEWWDAVNANYMRVFVPEGSQLISVEGQTREFNEPALDYDALGFDRDPDVVTEEESMTIDEESGTRIYQQNKKTVFANWVYVSPQESVTITYRYRLPWQVILNDNKQEGTFAAYDILYQKQHGSIGSTLETKLAFPSLMHPVWTNLSQEENDQLSLTTTLTTDHYAAVAFSLND